MFLNAFDSGAYSSIIPLHKMNFINCKWLSRTRYGSSCFNPVSLGQIVEKPRGDLEKVLPREDLKPKDVPKANPRVQPEGLPSEYP